MQGVFERTVLFPRLTNTVQILKDECCAPILRHINQFSTDFMVQILDDTRLTIFDRFQFSKLSLLLKAFSDRRVFLVHVECFPTKFYDLPGVGVRRYCHMTRSVPINPDELSGYHLQFFLDGT